LYCKRLQFVKFYLFFYLQLDVNKKVSLQNAKSADPLPPFKLRTGFIHNSPLTSAALDKNDESPVIVEGGRERSLSK
jgi:hypothetical protein